MSVPTQNARLEGDPASLPAHEVLEGLGSSAEWGLDAGVAKSRLESLGPNLLERRSREGILGLLWRRINDPLIWVLLASAALAIALGELTDAMGMHAVGPHVTELVAEGVFAKLVEGTPEELGIAVHAHPTLSEAFGEAALAVERRAINF